MPELPEVEVQVRGLREHALNAIITEVIVVVPNLISDKLRRSISSKEIDDFVQRISQQKIIGVTRRAKNICIELENGDVLLCHLKMTGQWLVCTESMEGFSAVGLVLVLDNGHRLIYRDTRKFGYVVVKRSSELQDIWNQKNYGLEPFFKEYDLKAFITRLIRYPSRSLKAMLLSQYAVVGLGNIYADEVCFVCGINPSRRVSTLTIQQIKLLFEAIPKLLNDSIELGGSSITTGTSKVGYRGVNGVSGTFGTRHAVYGKSGQSCSVCSATLSKITLASRTTVYCPSCQS